MFTHLLASFPPPHIIIAQSVFGCGGGTYIHAATHCGVYQDVGSSGEQIGYPKGMGVTDNDDNLHSVFNHAGSELCGVLCCKE